MDEEKNEGLGEAESSSSSASSVVSGIIAVFRWFMRLPGTLKMIILYGLGALILIFAVIVLIVALQGAATEVADRLFGWVGDIGDFFKDVGNFVTDIFNPDYEKKAEEAQNAYYQKLRDIADKYAEYGVQIDTTLITATLFYEKNAGDYVSDDLPTDEGDEMEDVQEYSAKEEYEFYKQAKNLIKTLAKYQIVETSTYNACSTSEYSAGTSLFPATAQEVAKNWDNWWDKLRDDFNSRRIFNYVDPSQIVYTRPDNTTGTIAWCPYSDAESQVSSYYNEDVASVEKKKNEYEACKLANESSYTACQNSAEQKYQSCQESAEQEFNSCIAQNSDEINQCKQQCAMQYHGSGEQYEQCLASCEARKCELKTCELETCELALCDAEKAEYDSANDRFKNTWITNGPYSEDGTFQCTSNHLLGSLAPYSGNSKLYENISFDLSGFTSGNLSKTGTIACSSNASVQYNYSIDIAREGVYYHKLLAKNANLYGTQRSFIETYYHELLAEVDASQREQRSIEIVEGIYEMYEDIADKQTYAFANSNMCPTGVKVIAGSIDNNSGHVLDPENYPIGTFGLEDYVAMVVNGENNSSYDESVKAQIIAARTYVLVRTDGCTKPIRNSTEDQVAKANPSDRIKKLVLETAGKVLSYDGEIFLAQYDSFDGTCNGSMCSAVYTKLPNGETHTLSVPTEFVEKDSSGNVLGGHGNGMSQCAANYLASQGYSYDEILKYFYSSGVEIMTGITVDDTVGTGIALSPSGITAALMSAGYTLESYSNELFTAVRNSELGSVSAVLTVAEYATSKFYNMTGGQKLNYTWGGGHEEYYAKRYGFYSPFALDCSSFISWVLYNAGFNYKDYVSGNWGNAGVKYPLSVKAGKPGDLIWLEGHIALIIAVGEDGYYTAEAYSPDNGIVNHFYAYDNSSGIYTVDMTNFYQKNINTANYPEGG